MPVGFGEVAIERVDVPRFVLALRGEVEIEAGVAQLVGGLAHHHLDRVQAHHLEAVEDVHHAQPGVALGGGDLRAVAPVDIAVGVPEPLALLLKKGAKGLDLGIGIAVALDGGGRTPHRFTSVRLLYPPSYTAGMANDEGFDLEDTLRALREADVVVIGFGWLSERLLIDGRSNETDGPYVRVVEPVRSPQDRIRQLRKLRPGFNDPESFVFFPWAGRVDAFVEAGLFERILDRCGNDQAAADDARSALRKLYELDREDIRQAIAGGEKYHTLYERIET